VRVRRDIAQVSFSTFYVDNPAQPYQHELLIAILFGESTMPDVITSGPRTDGMLLLKAESNEDAELFALRTEFERLIAARNGRWTGNDL
jgi:hypothetical protein